MGITFKTYFDLLLGLFILVIAWRALTAPRLYQSALFFIAFGLAMALAWARLAAPDVALAEAAIGAGLMGVLLLDSLRVFAAKGGDSRPTALVDGPEILRHAWERPVTTALVIVSGVALAAVVVAAIIGIGDGGGLTAEVAAEMKRSGVQHPVTAVLLNFRAYDTWLEVGVLLLAMLGIFCVGGKTGFTREAAHEPGDPILGLLVRALVPVMVLVAAYLLWLGKFAPGGAFQAGVILGASGIMLRLAGFRVFGALPPWAWKTGLAGGFGIFLAYGIFAMAGGMAFLEFAPDVAGNWILLIETACALSIAFTLTAFYVYLNT